MRVVRRFLIAFLMTLSGALTAFAQWSSSGVLISDTSASTGIWALPKSASDGAGGAYICWQDARGGDYDIYAQHLDSSGRTLWMRHGLAVSAISGSNQDYPRIVSDEGGGAFIAWEDSRSVTNNFPYVQHIRSDGSTVWPEGGIQATTTGGLFISLASDRRGGVILAYSTTEGVCAQRLDSLGARLWGDTGIEVTQRPGQVASGDVAVIADGSGGGIVVWAEGTYPNYQIYAQRLDSAGSMRWEPDGLLLSGTTLGGAGGVALSGNFTGTVVVNWNETDGSGRVQKLSLSGTREWQSWGIPLMVSGAGGAYRNSSDERGGAFVGKGLRIHHLDAQGNKLWGDFGVAFMREPGFDQGVTHSSQVHDGHQGIYNFSEYNPDHTVKIIQVQWIDSTGTVRFGPDGQAVTPHLFDSSQYTPAAAPDGRGGAIVAWNDFRSGASAVYAARVNIQGTVTSLMPEGNHEPESFELKQNYPNPFNPETTIRFSILKRAQVTLTVFDLLGREIASLADGYAEKGYHDVIWNAGSVSSGVYYARFMVTDELGRVKFMKVTKLLLMK